MMMFLAASLAPVGQTATDRGVVAAAWLGILALAAIILVVSAMSSPRVRR